MKKIKKTLILNVFERQKYKKRHEHTFKKTRFGDLHIIGRKFSERLFDLADDGCYVREKVHKKT